VDPSALENPTSGPREAARLLEALAPAYASEDAAVVALLCGEEPARYAQDRVRAEGKGAELEALARALPPRYEPHVRQAGHALTLGTAYGLAWPVDRSAISSRFGPRRNPVTGASQLHTGVDIPMPEGTQVRAVASGVVRRASEDSVNGKVLIVDHGHGVTTAYCHNSALSVSAGQRVERGQELSLSGNTGRSTGPHLHYQVELSGKPVDPLRYRPEPSTASRGEGP
jgi:murein DD-endopeptidase MepM/ murein hydrolase activator NlpD